MNGEETVVKSLGNGLFAGFIGSAVVGELLVEIWPRRSHNPHCRLRFFLQVHFVIPISFLLLSRICV